MNSKVLNILLLIAFVLTIMVPLTGLMVHKLVSVFFLILCAIHTIAYRKKMNWKRWGVLGIILVAFSSGIFGIVFEEIPVIIAMHKVISISSVFFLAIHIFVFHRKLTHQK